MKKKKLFHLFLRASPEMTKRVLTTELLDGKTKKCGRKKTFPVNKYFQKCSKVGHQK